ncbi:hypothetical protein DPEC_G00113870 [Dallia pectoralis]|uniref:Uncharacterized protein n=1 Tax=Dallia pectoralis TaxID=75939 RepID=A0ACC2GTV0_DALPE|nr:hypothetical protein DPEC_G00113870 [Dallia pectoralis]
MLEFRYNATPWKGVAYNSERGPFGIADCSAFDRMCSLWNLGQITFPTRPGTDWLLATRCPLCPGTMYIQSVPDPRQLRTLLQFHRKSGHLDSIGETVGDCILSSLHLFPRACVVNATQVHFFLRKNLWTPKRALCVRDKKRRGQWSGTDMDKDLLPSTGHDCLPAECSTKVS